MRFGYFDDERREYVITTPKTPLPWINYLGTQRFFSLTSHTAGGYSFYRDARMLRLTRYRYNNVPLDSEGHRFYLKEGDVIWNPGWQPVQTPLDDFSCRHGMGYTMIEGKKNGLLARQEMLVPVEDDCERIRLTLCNDTDRKKKEELFGYVEFCLWNAEDDRSNFQRNFSTGEVEVDGSVIYHKTEYRERRNHYAIWGVNAKTNSFDTSRDVFLGHYRSAANPEAVERGVCGNSIAHGWSPVGVHHITVELEPHEKKSFLFLLGYLENEKDKKWESPGVIEKTAAREMMARYATDEAFEQAMKELCAYWDELLGHFQVECEDEKLSRMVNIWNQYQCMVTFNLSRSASYFESGIGRGMGFRDSCQDLLGFVHMIPERARERILDIAATQFEDGSSYHQYQPLTKKGNADVGGGFNDDPLWLIAGTCAYLRETGDFSILEEQVPFDCREGSEVSLMEHLRRSIGYIISHKGPHGLPLIGRADWNDCLNLNCFSDTPGESFQTTGPSQGPVAESVFIAGMMVKYGREYAQLCHHLGLFAEEEEILQEVEEMKKATETAGWDGQWFRRAYDAQSNPVGCSR